MTPETCSSCLPGWQSPHPPPSLAANKVRKCFEQLLGHILGKLAAVVNSILEDRGIMEGCKIENKIKSVSCISSQGRGLPKKLLQFFLDIWGGGGMVIQIVNL